jgi:hypothetical protein
MSFLELLVCSAVAWGILWCVWTFTGGFCKAEGKTSCAIQYFQKPWSKCTMYQKCGITVTGWQQMYHAHAAGTARKVIVASDDAFATQQLASLTLKVTSEMLFSMYISRVLTSLPFLWILFTTGMNKGWIWHGIDIVRGTRVTRMTCPWNQVPLSSAVVTLRAQLQRGLEANHAWLSKLASCLHVRLPPFACT